MGLLDQPKQGGLLARSGGTFDKGAADYFAPGLFGAPSFSQSGSTQAVPDNTTPDTGTFLKEAIQAVPRDAAAIGISTGNLLNKKTIGTSIDPKSMGPLGRFVLGDAPVTGLADTAAGYETALAKMGIKGPGGTTLAVLGSTVPIALDFLGVGGEAGAVKAAVRAGTEGEAVALLTKMGVSDEVANQFAKDVVAASNKKEAQAVIENIRSVQKTASEAADTSASSALEIPHDVQAKAAADWETNYAEKSVKLSDDIVTLQNELKTTENEADRKLLQQHLDDAIIENKQMEDAFIEKWSPETGIVAEKSRFNTPEELVTEMGRPKNGAQGITLNGTEIKQLVDYMASVADPEKIAERGILYKPYGSKGEMDLVLGQTGMENSRLGGGKVVAEISKDGKFTGSFRIHATQLDPKSIVATLDQNELRALGEANASQTRAPMEMGVPGEAGDRPTANTPVEVSSREQVPVPNENSVSVSSAPSNHTPTDVTRPFDQVVGIGEKTTKEPNLYRRVTKKLDDALTSTVEYVQNAEIRVRKLMERGDVDINDANNAYQKATLYPGRVATKIDIARAQMESVANDLVDIADRAGRPVEDIRGDVNEYLQASHAPERNAALGEGAAGMTDDAARAARERIESSPEFPAIKKVADQVRALNDQGLVLLKESGVISDKLYADLTTKYKNHVPLNRVFDAESDMGGALSVRGFDVRSSGIKTARGSSREVADIIANVQHNYEQAVLRSEKNIVDQATLAFVRDNREALDGLMEVRKPKAVGTSFEGKPMMERTTDPSYLQLFEDGKPIWIKVTDPALAVALKGIGREKLPTLLNAVGAFTRLYAGLATRFNPEFAFPNKLRDLQETMIYMAAQKDVGFKGSANLLLRDPSSTKAVFDAIRGADTPGARIYKEMQEMGGTTGGFGLSTRKQVELDFDDMIATAQSKPREVASNVIKYIDYWNTIFEDSTRLSVYKQALAQGLSKDRAAFLAKEASINFNRMGRGGPVINAIWMFSNASMQGSAKMIRSLKNPKVAAAVITAVTSSVAAVNQWNDHIDPAWRDKVTKWDRMNGLPIILPNDKGKGVSYVVIPVSWGIKPIKIMADYAYDAAAGKDTNVKTMTSDLFTASIDAYNPLGGTDTVSALTPTVMDVPVEIARNQSWSGSKIHPDFDKNAPKDVQYFQTLGQTASGKAFIEGTKQLQESTGIALSPADMKYAFDQYIGGAGKAISKTMNTAIGAVDGKPVPADEYPFISRFYRTRTQEEVGQGAGGDTSDLKTKLEGQSRERFYATQAAEDKYTQLKALDPKEAATQWNEINKSDPVLAAKIGQIANQDKLGLDYTERLITQLGVENGERALYLKGKFDALKTNDEKAALWQNYVDKKIITPAITEQIDYLIQHPEVDPSNKQSKADGVSPILAAVTGAETAHAAEIPNAPKQTYYIRDNAVTPSDLDEAKAILFGEISNRTPDKQRLEAQTILNTAFNRMDAYRKRGINKTLTEVLQMDNQYQAYKGKEYTRFKTGSLQPTDQQKQDAIEEMIGKVKDGSFQNNIGDSVFYAHKPDGRIVATNKKLFAT